jgi:hypothetical protein
MKDIKDRINHPKNMAFLDPKTNKDVSALIGSCSASIPNKFWALVEGESAYCGAVRQNTCKGP